MAWNITADPDRYEEALAWFRGRVPMLKADWLALDEQARRRAFTIAGVSRVSIIQDVMSALESAVADGETLEDFKARVGSKLEAEWGRPNANRVDLIFRNAVQHAYNAGRYELATHPDVIQARPYWMFDAVLDNKTTPVCRASDGTVLPADHAFWKTHYPPLHHRCRSSVRNMTAAEAQERGIADEPPALNAADGWGHTPSLADAPKVSDVLPSLADMLAKAFGPPPSLNGAQVRDRLTQLDGDTAPQMKALEDKRDKLAQAARDAQKPRTPDVTPADWYAQAKAAYDAWVDAKAAALDFRQRRAAQAFEVLKADKPLPLRVALESNTTKPLAKATKAHWQAGVDLFTGLVGEQPGLALPNGAQPLVTLRRLPPKGRAFYRQAERTLYIRDDQPLPVIVHELGHWLEYNMPGALDSAKAFYARRTAGESFEKLRKLFPKASYDASEITKKDNFIDAYSGKYYATADGTAQRATELISMGLEYMIDDPISFAKKDPDHFDFIWHLLRGLPYK